MLTVQKTAMSLLVQAGCRVIKVTDRYAVLTKDDCGYWYIGNRGSIRYGRNRTEAMSGIGAQCWERFNKLTGVTISNVILLRQHAKPVRP
jgi:hypothetical protein